MVLLSRSLLFRFLCIRPLPPFLKYTPPSNFRYLIEPTSCSLPRYVVALHRCFEMWIFKRRERSIHVATHFSLNADFKLLIWRDRAGVDASIKLFRKRCADRRRKRPWPWGEYRLHIVRSWL